MRWCHASLINSPDAVHFMESGQTLAVRSCSACIRNYTVSSPITICSDRVRSWKNDGSMMSPLSTKAKFYTLWTPYVGCQVANVHGYQLTDGKTYALLFRTSAQAKQADNQNIVGMTEWTEELLQLRPCQLAKSFCVATTYADSAKSCEV